MDLSGILDKPSLVILIDCWDGNYGLPPGKTSDELMNNIKDFCINTPQVKAIGLATYNDISNDMCLPEEPWYSESKNLFHDTVSWELMRETWKQTQFVKSQRSTNPIIRDMKIRDDQVQFALSSSLELLFYCNSINKSIENIYVLGLSWESCLMFRPAGWREISNLNKDNMFFTKKNILSNLTCTVTPTNEYVTEVSAPWVKLDNNFVLLDENLI